MAQTALTIDGLRCRLRGVQGRRRCDVDGQRMMRAAASCSSCSTGAGKTTLMDLVSGKTKEHAGPGVSARRTDITNWEEHKIARAGVGRKFQIPSVFKDLTVRDNLKVASCRNPGALLTNLRFGFGKAKPIRMSIRCSS